MSEWISVKDRLPTEEDSKPWATFLVVCRTHGGYDGAYVSVQKASFYPDRPAGESYPEEKATDHYWEVDFGCGDRIPFDVTHWMPLPEPPNAET
jgi:hypothetical protein